MNPASDDVLSGTAFKITVGAELLTPIFHPVNVASQLAGVGFIGVEPPVGPQTLPPHAPPAF